MFGNLFFCCLFPVKGVDNGIAQRQRKLYQSLCFKTEKLRIQGLVLEKFFM